MCVVVALGVFAVSLTLCGCSCYQGAYVEAPPSALRHPIKASAVKSSPLPVRNSRTDQDEFGEAASVAGQEATRGD